MVCPLVLYELNGFNIMCVLASVGADKASSGDPDVIITGVEPSMGEAQPKEAPKTAEVCLY